MEARGDEDLDERMFGTTDVHDAIAHGTTYIPPDAPTPEGQLGTELEDYDVDPELRFLYDPVDYVRPGLLRYDVRNPRWVDEEVPCPRAAGAARAGATGGASASPAVAKVPLAATGAGRAVTGAGLVLLATVLVLRRRAQAV